MEAHEHHHQHQGETNNNSWTTRYRFVTYIGLGILAYFLLIELREHVFPLLPYLLLLACPFMHMFMHGGHGHKEHSQSKKEQEQ